VPYNSACQAWAGNSEDFSTNFYHGTMPRNSLRRFVNVSHMYLRAHLGHGDLPAVSGLANFAEHQSNIVDRTYSAASLLLARMNELSKLRELQALMC
jgi:hypothetical protein